MSKPAITLILGTLSALAFFQIASVPVPVAIALSIAFTARVAVLAGRKGDMPGDLRWHLAFVLLCALIHGSVFVNLGVEAGQLVLVAAVTGAMLLLRHVSLAPPVRAGALYSMGILGCFWMAERVTGSVLA